WHMLLMLREVTKAFGSLQVLDGLTLSVGVGEAVGGIGPNGAGKTTALNVMAGRLRPDRGAVAFVGRAGTVMTAHDACRRGRRVLLLDEIVGGLSEAEVQAMVGVVRQVRSEGVAIVWIEHVVHALRSAVDRLVAIAFGRNLMDGSPDTVMASPDVQRIYLGID